MVLCVTYHALSDPALPLCKACYSRLRVCSLPVFQDLVPCEMPVTARFLGRHRLLTRLTSRVFKQMRPHEKIF
jgi:hypothetical protein